MSLFKNFSFVFGAQTLILVVSILRALILPKFLSVEGFGYWEVYWFYTTWCGLFCLGYNDGIYLKYGEYNYNQLPIKTLRSSTRLFTLLLSIFTLISVMAILFLAKNPDIKFALVFSALDIIVIGLIGLCIYIFQITNQFKKYSFFSVIDKVIVLLTIVVLLIVNKNNYKYIIVADFVSKVLVLLFMIYKTRDLFIGETEGFSESLVFMWDTMKIGVKLLIANLMSMMLIGAGKFIVQIFGNIEDFARYSFGISITGLVLTAVTAFSLVLYPAVKRASRDRYSVLFIKINSFTRFFGLSAILLYFPVYYLVGLFYPQYQSVLSYLNILFALIFIQCKISILDNTYYKALREEKSMLKANISCVIIFTILALTVFVTVREIWVIALCTFLAMFYRCYSSEVFLNRKLELSFDKENWFEIFLLVVFLFSTSFLSMPIALVITIFVYAPWTIKRRKHIKNLVMDLVKK